MEQLVEEVVMGTETTECTALAPSTMVPATELLAERPMATASAAVAEELNPVGG